MQVDPETLEPLARYSLLIASILPRPIAWVSTISPEGVSNLAPFSFFNGVTAHPMSVCFSPVNNRDGVEKDTLINIRATKQFVVNIVTENNSEKMNETSANYPYGVSELEKVGLTPLPSVKVKPPRIKESPIHMECELLQVVTLSQGPLGGHIVIGKVVYFHADDAVLKDGKIHHQQLNTVGRMEGNWYARTRDAFELSRPEIKK